MDLNNARLNKYNKFLALAAVFLVIVFALVFHYFYQLSYKKEVKAFLEEQQIYLSIVEENLASRLKTIIKRPAQRIKESGEVNKNDLKASLFSLAEIKYAALLRKSGEISQIKDRFKDSSATMDLEETLQQLSREHWKEIEEDYYIPALLINPKRQLMVVFYPFWEQHTKNVIAVVSDLSLLADRYIRPVELKKHGTGYLIDDQGRVVYDRTEEIIGKNVFKLHQSYEKLLQADKRMMKEKEGFDRYEFVVRETGEVHTKYLSWSTIKLGSQELIVAIATPESSIMTEFNYFRNRFLVAIFLLVLLVVGISIIFFKVNNNFLNEAVNKLKKKYEEQREELELMSEMIEQADDSIIQTDTEGYIEYVNQSAEKLFGWSRAELYGKKPDIFNAEDNEEEIQKEIYQTLAAGESYERTLLNQRKDGSTFWCQIKMVAITNESGLPYAYTSIQRDVSDRIQREEELKKAKQEAEAANKAKSEFLTNMSHEIRTPLNAVIGFSELLEEIVEGQKEQNYLDSIKTAGNNLLVLINDILDLSKIEAGEFQLEYNYFDLKELLKEMEQMFSHRINEQGLSFMVDLVDEIPLLNLDEQRMRQIIINLIGNAVKFTEEGYIKIKVAIEKDTEKLDLYLRVIDTGIGIPKDKQAEIFSSFRQQNNKLSREYDGTGLGLSITERLTELMGGVIELESKVGAGSTFKLHFKEVNWRKKERLSRKAGQNLAEYLFSPAEVLAVDDIHSNRKLLKVILENNNLKVELAENGRSTVKLAKKKEFDLILLDLKLPDRDGYQVLSAIRENSLNADTPVLALTASATQNEVEKINKSSFDDFITKPLQRDRFLTLLADYLDHQIKEVQNDRSEVKDIKKQAESLTEVELKNLIQELKKLRVEYPDLSETFIVNEVEKFADRIVDLAQNYQLEFLFDYAAVLKDYTSDFDLDNAKQQLAQFEEIINKLEKSL